MCLTRIRLPPPTHCIRRWLPRGRSVSHHEWMWGIIPSYSGNKTCRWGDPPWLRIQRWGHRKWPYKKDQTSSAVPVQPIRVTLEILDLSQWNIYLHSGFSPIHNIGNNASIGIGGFTMWKKIQWQNVTPSGNRTQVSHNSDSKSNTILSTLTWHVLLRISLNCCSCTTWYLDLDDLRGINRAWLYKEPKVSFLQANVKLV